MNYRNLGKSELRVSLVGLGCNNFGMRIELRPPVRWFTRRSTWASRFSIPRIFMEAAAARKPCWADFGRAPQGDGPGQQIRRRHERRGERAARFAKLHFFGGRGQLQRLKTDWIDLYQFHFPDPKTPMERRCGLDDLVRQGKVRHIGISNHAAWQVVDAQWTAKERGLQAFISSQDEYSLLMRGVERELLRRCRRLAWDCCLLSAGQRPAHRQV